MQRLSSLLAALAAAFSIAAPASAAVLFTQAVDLNNAAFVSDLQGSKTFDDFTLATGGTVTGLEWYGTATNVNSPTPLGNPLLFTVAFYQSGFISQGGKLFAYPNLNAAPIYTVDALASYTLVGNTPAPRRDPVQRFTLTLPEPVELPGGQILWLGVYGRYGGTEVFQWRQAGPSSDPNAVWARLTGNSLSVFVSKDHGAAAFTLLGAAVPEPGTWALMIAGFGMTGAALRRRRAGGEIGRAVLAVSVAAPARGARRALREPNRA